jgi:hypothetical protein
MIWMLMPESDKLIYVYENILLLSQQVKNSIFFIMFKINSNSLFFLIISNNLFHIKTINFLCIML